MQILEGTHIKLRALEPEDLDLLSQIENNTNLWEISSTQTPYSRFVLKQYLENAHLDVYEAKQLRLVITDKKNNTSLGLIDLFDFNPQHSRAGIGILILDKHQNKGYASDALQTLINYVFKQLGLHQLYANILSDNTTSIQLFKKFNFEEVGIKKEWIKVSGNYKDEILFQLIHE